MLQERVDVVRPESAAERPPCSSPINFIFIGCVVKELHADVTSNPVVEEFEFTEKEPEPSKLAQPEKLASSKLPDPVRLPSSYFDSLPDTVKEAVANDEQVTF